MMIKAVLFDLDGTLVCTEASYRHDTTSRVLSGFGLDKSKSEIDRFWFKPGRDELVESWGLDPGEFWRAFRSLDTIESRRKHTYAFRDCAVLQDLRGLGMKLGIVTGCPPLMASMELDLVGTGFDAVVIANDRSRVTPKPHPHGILECLDMLGLKPQEAVFVGNSEEDIGAARKAGVLDILVDRGEHEFHGQEPSKRIKSLKELTVLLNKKNKN